MRTKVLIKRECGCGYVERRTTILTESQRAWLAKYPIDPGPCPGCGKDVEAVIRGSAEQEGVKR